MEPNFFPYDCPEGIEHWTLWSRKELTHREICEWIQDYVASSFGEGAARPAPVEWNYEENSHRSFDVPHVHVFFRFVLQEPHGASDLPSTPSIGSTSPKSAHCKAESGALLIPATTSKWAERSAAEVTSHGAGQAKLLAAHALSPLKRPAAACPREGLEQVEAEEESELGGDLSGWSSWSSTGSGDDEPGAGKRATKRPRRVASCSDDTPSRILATPPCDRPDL